MTTKVIKGGTVCTADRTWKADVLVEGEVIKQIGEDLKGDEYIDAEGAYVIPGGIDPHTHLEMPFMGTTAAETFESGTWAAAAGGTTMLIDFCLPGEDGSIKNAIHEWHRKSAPQICADIGYHMAITGWNESIFNEMKDAVDMGVNSFKHFMAYKGALMIEDDEMFASFKRCKELGALPMVHAENGDLVADMQQEMLAKGITGPEGHAYSRPPEFEGEAANRAITIADAAGVPLYIVHVSCEQAHEAIRRARQKGMRVYGEPLIQFLNDCRPYNCEFRKLPAQGKADVVALRDIAPGEEVVLFGQQGDGQITVHEVAAWADTITWDILTRLGKRVTMEHLHS